MGVATRTGTRVLATLVVAVLAVPATRAAAAGPVVTIESDSANLNTFQALNNPDTASTNKDGMDFVRFAENLLPPTLSGPEGKADTFAQQASTIVTPSSAAFPTQPINGISLSGRVRSNATKANNTLAGVPVADSSGSMSAAFQTSAPTPFQFSGALLATNDDTDNCTQITVQLTGPFNRSFSEQKGGGCSSAGPNTPGFVVTDMLPAGDYTLSVSYEAEVDPEQPGSLSALGEVDVNLQFLPPDTHITKVKINSQHHRATFRFKTVGTTKGVQCALSRVRATPKFKSCSSPKTFKHLKRGRYTFEARALGLAGPDATPAITKFRIK